MKHFYFLLFTLFTFTMNAQLATGDIAFTGYQSNNPDAFSFVVLVDIPANTSIEFTDNGWYAAGGFRTSEGTSTWTSPAYVLNAGTEILITDASTTVNEGTVSGTMAFSTGGDQLFAYDPLNVPTAGNETGFYAGIQMNGAWNADATDSNSSAQPTALIGYSLAIDPEVNNASYNCSVTTGTTTQLRTALLDPSNWTVNDLNTIGLPSCNFNPTISVENVSFDTFSVYPNPTSTGFVNITSKTNDVIQVTVYDILGKQVLNNTVKNNRLNVSTLHTGVYIFKISQNGNTITKKLVVR